MRIVSFLVYPFKLRKEAILVFNLWFGLHTQTELKPDGMAIQVCCVFKVLCVKEKEIYNVTLRISGSDIPSLKERE